MLELLRPEPVLQWMIGRAPEQVDTLSKLLDRWEEEVGKTGLAFEDVPRPKTTVFPSRSPPSTLWPRSISVWSKPFESNSNVIVSMSHDLGQERLEIRYHPPHVYHTPF